MFWANAAIKFLRLGPVGLGLIAILILVAGYFLQVESNRQVVTTAEALAAGAPPAVDIEAFDWDENVGLLKEVTINAQPVLDYAYQLVIERDGTDDYVFMVPLVARNAASETDIVGIAYFPSYDDDFSNITPELLMTGMNGFGSFGPMITYNGELGGMEQWDELTTESFFDEGLTMPNNPVIVWPYLNGREVAHAPPGADEWTIFGLLSKLAGAIGLLALAKIAFRSQPTPAQAAPGTSAADPYALYNDASAAVIDPAEAFEPESPFATLQPQPDATTPEMSFEATPPRRGFPIRKGLIGVIGAAFLALSAALVLDETAPATVDSAAAADASAVNS